MVLNNNYNDKKTRNKINELLGTSYSLITRLRLKGIGSTRIKIKEMSLGLKPYFGRANDIKYTIIELRPNGIIVYIRNSLNEYVWLIPFYKLTIYKSSEFSIHSEGAFIKCDLDQVYPRNKKFLKKLNQHKATYLKKNPQITDME